MTPLFNKLNLGVHREIVVIDAPATFESELKALSGVTVRRQAAGRVGIPFLLVFVQTLEEVVAAAKLLPQAEGDAVVWFAYPKMTSKRYRCEFNRDNGWTAVGAAGFEGVRMVAIDEDWSALRFRRVEFIKVMTRDVSHAKSAAGKARAVKRDSKSAGTAGAKTPRSKSPKTRKA